VKIKHLHISNFRGVKELDIDFSGSDGTPRPMTALIGDNGSGKTSVLQAIALVLSLATRRTGAPHEFSWPGFMPERVGTLGETRVQLVVQFDPDEISSTSSLTSTWQDSWPPDALQTSRLVDPGNCAEVELVYTAGKLVCPQGDSGLSQFLGRYFVRELSSSQPHLRRALRHLGDVFWFDQNRNIASTVGPKREEQASGNGSHESWETGVEQLREYLVGWWAYHTSPVKLSGKDYIPELEEQFNRVFPGTVFRGVEPRGNGGESRVSDFYFLLEREGRVFDISEMSSGEQAIFPLLYEFVRLDIARSVVLIDELELHLHPPKQQALLAALPKIGPDCQFIISTHSPYLEQVIPDEHEVRLQGGSICL